MEKKNGVLALFDGVTGQRLWQADFEDEVYATPELLFVDGDEVADPIIGGRLNDLVAVNGKTGEVLWTIRKANPEVELPDTHFNSPVRCRDLDGDGTEELLQVQSGGKDDIRPPGTLYVVSGKSGRVLASLEAPDGGELYCPPSWLELGEGRFCLVFGTGGEQKAGNLLRVDLQVEQGAEGRPRFTFEERWRVSGGTRGVIASVLILAPDSEGQRRVLASAFDGRLLCLSLEDGDLLFEREFPGNETYVPAVPIRLRETGPLGESRYAAVVSFSATNPWTGLNFPDNPGKTTIAWIDLQDGSLLKTRKIGSFMASSPVTADMNGDGADETVILVNRFGNVMKRELFNYLVIYDGATRQKIFHQNFAGLSSSTPTLADTDGNGLLDVIVANEVGVMRYEIQGSEGFQVTWGQYRGPDNSSVFTLPAP